jgi:hypothetical protein
MKADSLFMIKETYALLKERINSVETPRKVEAILFALDDDPEFVKLYEAMYFGQLMKNGLDKWKFYVGF